MPWDALVCTSTAALQVVHRVLGARADFLRWRFGPQARLRFPQLPVIPLGVHCAEFTFTADDKILARQALGIADDEVAVLYVGRPLLLAGKAHPESRCSQGLQAAAERTGKKVVGVPPAAARRPEKNEDRSNRPTWRAAAAASYGP